MFTISLLLFITIKKKKVYYCSFALKTSLRKYIYKKQNTPLFFPRGPIFDLTNLGLFCK